MSELGKDLVIYVNRRKFDEGDGVKPRMTGGDIALLVDVPPGNAVVRLERRGEKREIDEKEKVEIKHDDHFLVTRRVVEGGDMNQDRIARELRVLADGGQIAGLVVDSSPVVIYFDVPTAGEERGLPSASDVVVPVPSGYPGGIIDLAGLPVDSPFLDLVKGGRNSQGQISVADREWQLASYHPHGGGGGPPWDPNRHGFHTYLDHLIAWLAHLN